MRRQTSECVIGKELYSVVQICGNLWGGLGRSGAVWVVDRVLGQLGRAVKAIDSKSIGVTRVSSSLTAVDQSISACVVC